jgi:hypothetical protein
VAERYRGKELREKDIYIWREREWQIDQQKVMYHSTLLGPIVSYIRK